MSEEIGLDLEEGGHSERVDFCQKGMSEEGMGLYHHLWVWVSRGRTPCIIGTFWSRPVAPDCAGRQSATHKSL